VLHLPGLDELPDRAGDVLDGYLRVHPVLVVQVDGVDAEPVQRAVDHVLDNVGTARDPPPGLASRPLVPRVRLSMVGAPFLTPYSGNVPTSVKHSLRCSAIDDSFGRTMPART